MATSSGSVGMRLLGPVGHSQTALRGAVGAPGSSCGWARIDCPHAGADGRYRDGPVAANPQTSSW